VCQRGTTIEMTDEVAGRYFSHLHTGIVDGGEAGRNNFSHNIIIETADGDVFRNADAFFLQVVHDHGGRRNRW